MMKTYYQMNIFLSQQMFQQIDSAMSMTPFSDEFLNAKVNNIYSGDPAQGMAGIFVNMTLKVRQSSELKKAAFSNPFLPA